MIKDSGNRRKFESGAVRDMEEGKGRCDLLPACALLRLRESIPEEFENPPDPSAAFVHLLKYLDGQDDIDHLAFAAGSLLNAVFKRETTWDLGLVLPPQALLCLSKHYEAGSKKYGDRNWEKGIPVSSFIDSAIRHILKHLSNETDEDHLIAAAWNVLGAMWTEEKYPELINIPGQAYNKYSRSSEQMVRK